MYLKHYLNEKGERVYTLKVNSFKIYIFFLEINFKYLILLKREQALMVNQRYPLIQLDFLQMINTRVNVLHSRNDSVYY